MAIPRKILWQPWDRQAAGVASQTKSRTAKLGSQVQFAQGFVIFNQSWKEINISPLIPKSGLKHIHQQTHFLLRVTGNCFACLLKSNGRPD